MRTWLAPLAMGVLLGQSDQRLRLVSADLLENREENGRSVQILSGHVIFRKGDMTLTTDKARFFTGTGRSFLEGNVVMTRPGERLTSDELDFQNDQDLIIARDNVRFEKGRQTITSDGLLYWTENDSAFATGNVLMAEDGRSLAGQKIAVYYNGQTVERVLVENDAQARSALSALMSPGSRDRHSFTDVMTSRRMVASFEDDHLSSLELQGMSTSLYHVVEDSVLQGINHASSDTMVLMIDDTGRLYRLQAVGGARGRFEPEPANAEVDTVVLYKGAFIDYDINAKVTYLEGGARVDYRDNGLAAGSITVTWEDNLLRAEPDDDERPTLYQPGQAPMEGELMEFDLAAEKGRVVKGRTRLDNGYYHGELIHRHPGNIFYVRHSIYTTCDLDRPHFYFAANRMKMLQGDKVVARPMVLYIMDVPVLGLPFAIFPNQAGRRRSGWIMPSYGDNRRNGQFLQGLGYYWAMNDYMDARALVDFYSKQGVRGKGRLRYNMKHKFSGRFDMQMFRSVLSGDIARLLSDDTELQWSGSWQHRQSFDPTQQFVVKGTFTSDPQLSRRLGRTQRERLNQQIVSNASYSKRWRQSGSSLTLALQDRYDLQAQEKLETAPATLSSRIVERTQVLPRLRYSRSRRSVVSGASGGSGKWYSGISWSLSSELNNNQTIFWDADTADGGSLVWSAERQIQRRSLARHSVGLSNSMKVMRYISLSLGMNLREGWILSHRRALTDDSTGIFLRDSNNKIRYNEVEVFSARHTGALSLSAQTNIYGLFPVRIGSIEAIRHTIKPSISYTYAPDFSKPFLGVDLGYFQQDSEDELFDRFSGSAIGGTSSSERQALSFGLTNLFQAKREVDGKDEKFTLLKWTMSGGYNFAAEKFKISPLRSSFRSPLLQQLNLDISMEHDFYEWDRETNTKIDKVLKVPRLSRVSASTHLKLSGRHLVPSLRSTTVAVDTATAADSLFNELEDNALGETAVRRGKQAAPKIDAGNLWEANLSMRYSLKPSLDPEIAQAFWLNSGIKLAVGKGWRVGYQARFNLLDQELVSHDIRFYRQLHCWEFTFNWTPSGLGQGFYLSINVIDRDLKDIKYESLGGRQSIFGN